MISTDHGVSTVPSRVTLDRARGRIVGSIGLWRLRAQKLGDPSSQSLRSAALRAGPVSTCRYRRTTCASTTPISGNSPGRLHARQQQRLWPVQPSTRDDPSGRLVARNEPSAVAQFADEKLRRSGRRRLCPGHDGPTAHGVRGLCGYAGRARVIPNPTRRSSLRASSSDVSHLRTSGRRGSHAAAAADGAQPFPPGTYPAGLYAMEQSCPRSRSAYAPKSAVAAAATGTRAHTDAAGLSLIHATHTRSQPGYKCGVDFPARGCGRAGDCR